MTRARIRTIVAGIAEADPENPVLRNTAVLAERLGARLVLLHAFHLPHPMVEAYYHAGVFGSHIDEDYGAEMAGALEAAARRFAPSLDVRARAVAEPAVAAILRTAEKEQADLLVVGATRRGAVGRKILGTTADRIIRETSLPVLVMRRPLPDGTQRVLFTTDLTEHSGRVFEGAADLVEALADEDGVEARCLLAVWWGATLPPPLASEVADELVQKELASFLAGLSPRPFEVEPVVRVGSPAAEIVSEAKEAAPGLVVVGTHSRRGLERLFLGSVAAATIRDLPCNVLVVPTPEHAPGMAPEAITQGIATGRV